MSRTTDKDSSIREPSVYVQSTMDSVLEKKSQGVLRMRTKIRCWLHGSTLYEQKDQDVKLYDIRQAQTVRKVTNDPTRTQFEIVIKKKTHTYICSSSEECQNWVTALQKCMMLKDSSDMDSSSMFYTEEDSLLYSTIDDTDTGAGPSSCSSPSSESNNVSGSKDYYTPYDAVEERVTNHNDYEDVELRKSSYGLGNQDTQNDLSKDVPDNNVYSDGISEPAEQNYTYASVMKNTTDLPNDFATLESALSDSDLLFDDLPHSLTSEDLSCVRTLKTFLRSNDMYHRSSSLRKSNNENCLSALKACLGTLSID